MDESSITQDWSNVGIVVSHPAHLIMVAGMIQRFRPHFLIIGASSTQVSIVKEGFSMLGMQDAATFLDLPDSESYRLVHTNNYSLHRKLEETIHQWLCEKKPNVVIGDAFELSNFQHDVTRFLLDNALKKYKLLKPDVQNFEIPICCRTEDGIDEIIYQQFPRGEFNIFRLSEREVTVKMRLADWASKQDDFIAGVCNSVTNIDEPFRRVPWNRDYTKPPEGLMKHYDERGHEEVAAGTYEKPILFDKHFVPLVNELKSIC